LTSGHRHVFWCSSRPLSASIEVDFSSIETELTDPCPQRHFLLCPGGSPNLLGRRLATCYQACRSPTSPEQPTCQHFKRWRWQDSPGKETSANTAASWPFLFFSQMLTNAQVIGAVVDGMSKKVFFPFLFFRESGPVTSRFI